MDPVLDVLAIARLDELAFHAKGCLMEYLYHFAISIVIETFKYTDMSRGVLLVCQNVRVLFGMTGCVTIGGWIVLRLHHAGIVQLGTMYTVLQVCPSSGCYCPRGQAQLERQLL